MWTKLSDRMPIVEEDGELVWIYDPVMVKRPIQLRHTAQLVLEDMPNALWSSANIPELPEPHA